MILRTTLLCLALTACSDMPVVVWPSGSTGTTPPLLPEGALPADTANTAEARGAALLAAVAALRARAAAIGN